MYYTYIHYKADTLEPFYVGKGKDYRHSSRSKRNPRWHHTVKKHGLKVEIIGRWPTSKEALDHEVFLISCLRGMGVNLCNLTRGGDGLVDPSEETRKKISASLTGRPGVKKTEAQKLAMSQSRMGRGNPMFGRTVSESAKEKRRKTLKENGYSLPPDFGKKVSDGLKNGYHPMRGRLGGVHHSAKPVRCITTGDEFGAISDAVRWLKANGKEKARDWNIGAACRGARASAYGMEWEYIE